MDKIRWYKIDQDIPEGEFVRQISIGSKKLCLLRHDGKMHLLQNSCPHAGAVLSNGWCENGMLICPVHRYAYGLENGRGAAGQGDYIEIYPLRQLADGWYAGIKRGFFSRLLNRE